ncbi:hypothetical protein PTD2_22072 [Pseudoalteromonas tunicata D2]|uniref:Uncharacterized protein n=1 Tax=Pseudoalteromonas tunicata D2 TaxID=87626 RepID=A4CAZ0_9GAMM|nr:hypothetical protein PTD2_22072 [Pseudoalteromonas tunicata D2]
MKLKSHFLQWLFSIFKSKKLIYKVLFYDQNL